jgi:hypothetical protein
MVGYTYASEIPLNEVVKQVEAAILVRLINLVHAFDF